MELLTTAGVPDYNVQARQALGTMAWSGLQGAVKGAMLRFFIIFSVLLLGLFTLEILQPAEKYVILPFTSLVAHISVWIVQFFDHTVIAAGNVIRDQVSGFGVRIERGCNGLEAVIILFSAIFAFPAPLKNKLIGFVAGFFAIQLLNLVRIISLFYLGQWNYTAFEWFHLYLWQALIILDALVVWLIWLRTLPASGRHGGSEPGTDSDLHADRV
jgi:exosortase H (IPTLxxWG-CTERM-specific)